MAYLFTEILIISLSSVLPTSQVFTSGYVNTETILHFFYKITNERGTKHSAKILFIKLIKITILPESPPSNQNCPLKTAQELSSPSKKLMFVEMQWMRLIDTSETNASTRNVKRKSKWNVLPTSRVESQQGTSCSRVQLFKKIRSEAVESLCTRRQTCTRWTNQRNSLLFHHRIQAKAGLIDWLLASKHRGGNFDFGYPMLLK